MARQQLILDRYRVKKKAGAGGYGSVYHAYDTKLKRNVAIKTIEVSEADMARARLIAMEERLRDELAGTGEISLGEADGRAGSELADAAGPSFSDGQPDESSDLPSKASLTRSFAAADAGDDQDDAPDFAEDDLFDHIPGLQEARMVAQLSDKNIVTVYDCVLQDGVAYIIMEYVEGKTLAQILDESADLVTPDVIAAVFSSVAHALDVAHSSEVLHLDIKPDNVMVDKRGVVKVTDFGLATLTDSSGHGAAGGGTIGYMPLEQMRQEALDVRTDEWALASLTYEMISGSNPFFADDLDEAEAAIEEAELVLPSLCWDEFDSGIDDVVFTALDLEPDERYPSIARFADALNPYLGDAEEGSVRLSAIVRGAEVEEPEAEPEPLPPAVPLVERVSDRAVSGVVRFVSAAGAAAVAALALVNIHLDPASAWGLANDAAPVFAGLLLAVVVLAALKPRIGALASLIALSAALLANAAYALGVGLLLVSFLWWRFAASGDETQAAVLLLQPLLGSAGFAAVSPVAAGCFLTVGRAAATASFSAFLAVILASFGSRDLMGWNALGNARFSGLDVQAVFLDVVTDPGTWVVAASWVAAAVLVSLFCARGTKGFDVTGACLAAAALIAGACVAAGVEAPANASGAATWLPSVGALVGSLFPGVLGVLLAGFGVADRVRWEPEAVLGAEEA